MFLGVPFNRVHLTTKRVRYSIKDDWAHDIFSSETASEARGSATSHWQLQLPWQPSSQTDLFDVTWQGFHFYLPLFPILLRQGWGHKDDGPARRVQRKVPTWRDCWSVQRSAPLPFCFLNEYQQRYFWKNQLRTISNGCGIRGHELFFASANRPQNLMP